jgi:signal transduction histidine kinase/DNA-binding NarL/FixJ family response regulator
MLVPGTQMHIITFLFACFESVLFFYLVIYKLSRPGDKTTILNITLIFLLIIFNLASGLLPDPNLMGSFIVQESIAYASGFIAPTYFPYYVYKAFDLKKMKFHAFRGVYIFLIIPYILFVIVLGVTNDLNTANYVLIIPVFYAPWVVYSLFNAVKFKYQHNFRKKESREEIAVMFLSITPWVAEPAIVWLSLGQVVEATMTNLGFLLLFSLHVKRHIKAFRTDHQRLIESEQQLLNWNANLQIEVEKRTRELKLISDQRANAFVNLAHEIKTPLTLMKNYFEEYSSKAEASEDLLIVKNSINKLSSDVLNLFDIEKFNKGLNVYNHSTLSNLSEILRSSLLLFEQYAKKRQIDLQYKVDEDIFIKADAMALYRIINNVTENAIKFTNENGKISVSLQASNDKVLFCVKDSGIGIPAVQCKKIFEPYYTISNHKSNRQGMGLGLSIVKNVVAELEGAIEIVSIPAISQGTEIRITLNRQFSTNEIPITKQPNGINQVVIKNTIDDKVINDALPTIMIIEDNLDMLGYLSTKVSGRNYNILVAINGNEAIKKLKSNPLMPDLFICDVMMDTMDGYQFREIISKDSKHNHIPFIFLTAKSEMADKVKGLKLGAIDFIMKPFSINELMQKIESIINLAGKKKELFLNSILKSSIETMPSVEERFKFNSIQFKLTQREIEIVKYIEKGCSYKEIGTNLFISDRTVEKHVQNIFKKVEVGSKIELLTKLNY